jgi:hypothetical protein
MISGTGYVVLNIEDPASASDSLVDAMKNAFGSNWQNQLKLKYQDWNVDYTNSPFKGHETELLGRVEGMTDSLADAIVAQPGLVGANFTKYMKEVLKFTEEDLKDEQKVADAAVLYVASGTSSLTPEKKEQFKSAVISSGGDFEKMLNGLIPVYNSNVMAAAATYAMLVSWCQYEDNLNKNNALMSRLAPFDCSGIDTNNVDQLLGAIMATMDPVGEYMAEQEGKVEFHAEEYFAGPVADAIDGFVQVMGTANSVKDQVTLGSENCFNNQEIQNLFTQFGKGSIIILAEILEDGSLKITNPLND